MKDAVINLNLPKKRYATVEVGILRRLLALLIDILILDLVVLTPFTKLFQEYFPIPSFSMINAVIPSTVILAMIEISLCFLIYFTLFQYYFRQTYGMMLARIRVEGDLTMGKSLMRSIMTIPFFPFYLFWIIEPIAIIARRKGILEQWTGTRTIATIEL